MNLLVKGHWIKRMEILITDTFSAYTPKWYCSECGTEYDACVAKRLKSCPNCGAYMMEAECESDSNKNI